MTWLAGVSVLAALIALIWVGYELSPFGEAAAQPTREVVAGLPTLPPDPPTATPEGEEPTATVPAASAAPVVASATMRPSLAPSPTLRPTQPPTATTAATPTTRPSPTVTSTAVLVSVPDLTGKTLKEAQAAADELGLVVEQVGEGYSSRPVGQVIEQQPLAGKRLARGGTITVIISRGPQTVQIPDVKGQGYEQAAETLERAGLVVARQDVPSRNVPPGIVIDQEPLPSNTVAPGTTVTLTVSLGDVVVVPDLFGVPIDVARQRLTDAGFVVLVNGQSKAQIEKENPAFFAVYPEVRDGWVISQSLPAGSHQPRGATIAVAYYKAK